MDSFSSLSGVFEAAVFDVARERSMRAAHNFQGYALNE
jgi:hypothetical protein